jgi:hypothetical protein
MLVQRHCEKEKKVTWHEVAFFQHKYLCLSCEGNEKKIARKTSTGRIVFSSPLLPTP